MSYSWRFFIDSNSKIEKCKPDGSPLCKNGGVCVIDDQGDAKCKCPTYFDGLHCEICKCLHGPY